ncbi:MAG: ATP-binding cassette domain-containing protein [Ruminococcaceae bacterium]|nr:ATP-binding cassette domain-containing protein [Oscillospiraceae bacterium]
MQIAVKSLSFRYPNAEEKTLDNINFELPEGSFTTLCGMSGSGKSTLLRMLKPCLRPHGELSGEILPELSENQAAREIGFVMQNPEAQICTDRVWHELAFSLESVGERPEKMRRGIAECAEYFGLEQLFERETSSLSGGEKQLLALASAAALHPKLLLLDEPTSQLDPVSARSFFDIITRLNRDLGMTVLIAEHRLEELFPISDRVIVMDKGRVIADREPRGLLKALPKDHPMLSAFPVSMRIFALANAQGEPPVSIREGRQCSAVTEYLQKNKPMPLKSDGKPILTVKDLCVCYGKRAALSSVSLSVRKGEVYALLGGNGSGKSTLLKAIFGIVKPFGGKITRDKTLKLAYLPQNPCMILDEEALDLSGGEQQRLALEKLLSQNPDVLLLDEPTKGMDAHSKAIFAEKLREINATVLLVTHDLEFAASCADRCGLLFNGEIVSEGEPTDFFAGNFFYTTPLCRLAKGITEGHI